MMKPPTEDGELSVCRQRKQPTVRHDSGVSEPCHEPPSSRPPLPSMPTSGLGLPLPQVENISLRGTKRPRVKKEEEEDAPRRHRTTTTSSSSPEHTPKRSKKARKQKKPVQQFLNFVNYVPPAPASDRKKDHHSSSRLVRWLLDNFEAVRGSSLAKDAVYTEYVALCKRDGKDPMLPSMFGKLVHRAFPGLKSSRTGTKGQAKHCYKGFRLKDQARRERGDMVEVKEEEEREIEGPYPESELELIASSSDSTSPFSSNSSLASSNSSAFAAHYPSSWCTSLTSAHSTSSSTSPSSSPLRASSSNGAISTSSSMSVPHSFLSPPSDDATRFSPSNLFTKNSPSNTAASPLAVVQSPNGKSDRMPAVVVEAPVPSSEPRATQPTFLDLLQSPLASPSYYTHQAPPYPSSSSSFHQHGPVTRSQPQFPYSEGATQSYYAPLPQHLPPIGYAPMTDLQHQARAKPSVKPSVTRMRSSSPPSSSNSTAQASASAETAPSGQCPGSPSSETEVSSPGFIPPPYISPLCVPLPFQSISLPSDASTASDHESNGNGALDRSGEGQWPSFTSMMEDEERRTHRFYDRGSDSYPSSSATSATSSPGYDDGICHEYEGDEAYDGNDSMASKANNGCTVLHAHYRMPSFHADDPIMRDTLRRWSDRREIGAEAYQHEAAPCGQQKRTN